MTTSERTLYVYLQRPDNAQWVVVGRYQNGPGPNQSQFRYADGYLEAAPA